MSILDDIMGKLGSQPDYNNILSSAAEKYGIPDKLPILQKILNVESSGNPNATSKKGASGLMQLMPGTARSLGVKNIYDPEENIHAGVRYFADQLKNFGSDDLALAAYNAGPGAVKKYGGIPPYRETQKYVTNILGSCKGAQNCGDAVARVINDSWGDKVLPYGGLGQGDVIEAAKKLGRPVLSKGGITLESLQSLGPGTVIRMTRQPGDKNYEYGDTHAEVTTYGPSGELAIASYTAGKGLKLKPLTQDYIASLPSRTIATNLMPDTAGMVADVTGQAIPPNLQNPQSPEKQNTIATVLSDLASKIGPSQAEAASPPKSGGLLADIMKEVYNDTQLPELKKEGPSQPQTMPMKQTSEGMPSLETLAQIGAVDDPKAKFRILAAKRFPNEPVEQAIKRYRIDGEGNIKFFGYDNKEYLEIPKGFLNSAKSFIGQNILGRAPEVIGAGAGLAYGGPLGLLGGAYAGSMTRQYGAEKILGDKPKSFGDKSITAVGEAATALISQGVGSGIVVGGNKVMSLANRAGYLKKLAAHEAPTINQAQVARLVELGDRYGIKLTAPEITGSPTLQGIWHRLSMVPGTPKERIRKFIEETRMPEINQAIQRELELISPESELFRMGQMGSEAATKIEEKLVSTRKANASGKYKEGIETAQPVDLNPVVETIDSWIANAGGSKKDRLEAVKKLFFEKYKDADGEIKERLHTDIAKIKDVRDDLNDMISGKYDPAMKPLKNGLNREATIIKKALSGKMHEASPLFQEADVEFARLSKPINEYLYGTENRPSTGKPNTIVARIGRITNEEELEKVPEKVFGASSKAIGNMKQYFLDNGYESEWRAIVRGHLQDQLNKVTQSEANQAGMAGAAFRRKVFFDPTDIEKLRTAFVNPSEFSAFRDFMDLLNVTGKIVYTNSQTIPMYEAGKAIEQSIGGAKGAVLKMNDAYATIHDILFNPRRMGDKLRERWAVSHADVVLDAMMDTRMAESLAEIRRLPNTPAKVIKFGALIGGIAKKHGWEQPTNVKPEN